MATTRKAVLEGTKAAARLHDDLGLRGSVASGSHGAIDVFGAILARDAALLFRPLQGLLGAYLPGPVPGVIISTQRPLRVQRFTGAHELGHDVLGHQASLDGEEILGRAPRARAAHDPQEVAADAFAAEFLVPKWLLQHHARRQGWNRASMADPAVVYQLALRVGASYDATCRALERDRIIDADTRQGLLAVPRRRVKEALLDGQPVEDWHRDVWLLTERDEGMTVEGQPEDVFVLKLREKGGAGYLWSADGLRQAGFVVLRDRREIPPPEQAVGGPTTRALTARRPEPARGDLALELRRPWQKSGAPLSRMHLLYDLFGKEVGMPRAVRRRLLQAA